MVRVFLLEPCRQNTEDAKRFGEVKYLFLEEGSRSSIWAEEFTEELLEELDLLEFNPNVDYILVAGGVVPNFIAAAAIGGAYGQFKALLYDAKTSTYKERLLK